MSDGSNSSPKTLLEPLRHIGAQDILKIEGKLYDGILRKRGKLDKLLGSTRWKQRFVVISQGCVYCFKDEYAQRPLTAFSLAVYECVNEVEIGGVLNCFEVVHEIRGKSAHYFSCETEDKRKTWISYLQDAMGQAHMHSGGKFSSESLDDEGICMGSTSPASVASHRKSRGPLPPLPPTPSSGADSRKYKSSSKSEYDLESDEDEPYDMVKEDPPKTLPGQVPVLPGLESLSLLKQKRKTTMSQRAPMQIPSPGRESAPAPPSSSYTPTTVNRSQDGRPVIVTKLDYINEKPFQDEDYYLDTVDKEKVKSLLSNRPVGTFLIRRGNSTPTVLCVVTDQGSKDFQIFEENGKLTLNKAMFFPSRDALLLYYKNNVLPKKEYSVMLKKGYAFKG